ncbi:MAG: hypothetical protein LBQ31_11155 [Bacteroidales bacterium]|jgi:hypothetical protein|nr:hypothetical protein [Bacteroidales bacterium]
MSLRKHFILFVAIVLCATYSASGQFRHVRKPEALFASEDKPARNGITIEAVPFFFNGFSLAYERYLAKGHWLVLQPTYYTTINYASSRKDDIQNMQGFSIALYHRYTYYTIESVGFGLYLQWGGMYYQNHIVQVKGEANDIRKVGIDIAMGFRQTIIRPLYFTFYVGYGERFIIQNKNKVYMKNVFDHGYGGTALSIGFGLGFRF